VLRRIDPSTKSAGVIRAMFDEIAPRYDLLNHLLSMGQDRGWRRRLVAQALAGSPAGARVRVLDVCCGTGDLALEFCRRSEAMEIVGVDFSMPMLERALRKQQARAPEAKMIRWVAGDAMQLPVADRSIDVVSVAFGLRNLTDPERGIRELACKLRRGGQLLILEFFRPARKWLATVFLWYFRNVLPRLGRCLSRARRLDAYQYLPDSVERFVSPQDVGTWMVGAGLENVRIATMCAGAVALISARTKPLSESSFS